jgi:4,5-dihydroxyphthalate decarboxylase
MSRPLTLACWDYDRTAALADGRVRPEGVELTYLSLPVEEIFFRMARFREFDAAELSLSSYVVSLDQGSPFTAIPVFPSRSFRHNGIYVNARSGIESPSDLAGRVVGIPEYQLTAVVWIRGILADFYDVPLTSVTYRTGGLHSPGRQEKLSVNPPGVTIEPIGPDDTLDDMLVSGRIDALYTPRTPAPFLQGDPVVRRLFDDPAAAEMGYFKATGIFPIMHTLVLRTDLYEEARWLARSLLKACAEAKQLAESRLEETAASISMLPWAYEEARQVRAVMGHDFWPYGLKGNEVTLRTFLRYMEEQGLASRRYEPAELFAPETADEFVI